MHHRQGNRSRFAADGLTMVQGWRIQIGSHNTASPSTANYKTKIKINSVSAILTGGLLTSRTVCAHDKALFHSPILIVSRESFALSTIRRFIMLLKLSTLINTLILFTIDYRPRSSTSLNFKVGSLISRLHSFYLVCVELISILCVILCILDER